MAWQCQQSGRVQFGPVLARWRQLAAASGHEVVESLGAVAQPGGPVDMEVYESFKQEILSDLEQAMPVDVVLLQLHGAMSATECDDCEGDLLKAVRQLVGPDAVIGAELDLHCLLSPEMVDCADLLVSYKEYPHSLVQWFDWYNRERFHQSLDNRTPDEVYYACQTYLQAA